jgi:large-conductance mechanosensitive channel
VCSSVYFPAECLVIAISDFIFSSSSSFPLLSLVDQLAFPLMTQLVKKNKKISNRRFENWKLFSFVFYRRKTFKTSFAVAWNSLAGLSSFFFLFRWGLFISNKKRKERKNERKKEEEKKDMEANGFNSRLSIAFCGRAHT